MAKDRILQPFLSISKDKFTVDTIEDLKRRIDFKVGDVVELNGYYSAGDGADHKRKVESVDDGSGVQLANGLWGNIINNYEIKISWFGIENKSMPSRDKIDKVNRYFKNKKNIKINFEKFELIIKKENPTDARLGFVFDFVDCLEVENCNIKQHGIGDTLLFPITNPSSTCLTFRNCDNLKLNNVKCDGNARVTTKGSFSTETYMHGISILSCKNVILEDVISYNNQTDGMILGYNPEITTTDGKYIATENVTMRNVNCRNNGRQGLSLIGAYKIKSFGCDFSNTGKTDVNDTGNEFRTLPGYGVDFEHNFIDATNLDTGKHGDFHLYDCSFINNSSSDFASVQKDIMNVTFNNCKFIKEDVEWVEKSDYSFSTYGKQHKMYDCTIEYFDVVPRFSQTYNAEFELVNCTLINTNKESNKQVLIQPNAIFRNCNFYQNLLSENTVDFYNLQQSMFYNCEWILDSKTNRRKQPKVVGNMETLYNCTITFTLKPFIVLDVTNKGNVTFKNVDKVGKLFNASLTSTTGAEGIGNGDYIIPAINTGIGTFNMENFEGIVKFQLGSVLCTTSNFLVGNIMITREGSLQKDFFKTTLSINTVLNSRYCTSEDLEVLYEIKTLPATFTTLPPNTASQGVDFTHEGIVLNWRRTPKFLISGAFGRELVKNIPDKLVENGSLFVDTIGYVKYKTNNTWHSLEAKTGIQLLNTPYHVEKMKSEGVYTDFISYMDEKVAYDNHIKNQSDTVDGVINLSIVEEPVPSKELLAFKEKYLR